MDCKEIQRLIRPFLKNELSEQKRHEFIMHVRTCKECMDELNLDFIVTVGVNLLDEDGSIDLNKEFHKILDEEVHRNKVQKRVKASFFAIAAMIACIVFLVGSSGLIY